MYVFDRFGKKNFIDEANTIVGFDMSAQCCEEFYYQLTDDINVDLDWYTTDDDAMATAYAYVFDTNYQVQGDQYVQFKLIRSGHKDLYLNLINEHNGFYSHGFTVSRVQAEGRI